MTTESALAVFVGAYLNQDLYDFYEDEFAAVRDFAAQDPDLAAELPDEIDTALARHRDEFSLQQFLDGLGLEITPSDVTYREWLTQLADRARSATAVSRR